MIGTRSGLGRQQVVAPTYSRSDSFKDRRGFMNGAICLLPDSKIIVFHCCETNPKRKRFNENENAQSRLQTRGNAKKMNVDGVDSDSEIDEAMTDMPPDIANEGYNEQVVGFESVYNGNHEYRRLRLQMVRTARMKNRHKTLRSLADNPKLTRSLTGDNGEAVHKVSPLKQNKMISTRTIPETCRSGVANPLGDLGGGTWTHHLQRLLFGLPYVTTSALLKSLDHCPLDSPLEHYPHCKSAVNFPFPRLSLVPKFIPFAPFLRGFFGGSRCTDGGTLLGAIAGLGALLLVFLLYIKNKRWWWSSVGGMGCCDEACPPVSSRPVPSPPVPATSFTPAPLKHKLANWHVEMLRFNDLGCDK
ncbi:hypothetical protein GEV33_005919 [Tenebrio molitor]|uniref:Uncharacterized protein n=1 Tax=Tenebrio molitor TaxID=7067 RepID=A0A8J6HLZ3_TENMO|nr:hypothetical protein GEV33_005919 [Tenebrio molitor]